MYFTDGGSPWQKGTKKNSSGLLREFYPKERILTRIRQSILDSKIALINNRPRKVLEYCSALKNGRQNYAGAAVDLTIHLHLIGRMLSFGDDPRFCGLNNKFNTLHNHLNIQAS